jgi:hypothetical protein
LFGAAIAILALGLNPFSQQIATFRSRMAISSAEARNWRSTRYGASLPSTSSSEGFAPILPFKNAVYNGLFAENNKPWLSLPVNCPTGNCTWAPFDSLGVCNSCVDMSDFMERFCLNGVPADGNKTTCGWQLPNGAKLNTSAQVFSMTPFVSR